MGAGKERTETAARRTARMEVAGTRFPSFSSSPRILT
jgi:hypothetical protein